MTGHNQALLAAEYTTLRTELLENKKYVFERGVGDVLHIFIFCL